MKVMRFLPPRLSEDRQRDIKHFYRPNYLYKENICDFY